MSKALEVQDFRGHHNKNLEATIGRLTKGGSWKKQRIIWLVPAGVSIPTRVVLPWMNLVMPPNQALYRHIMQNMEVGEAYSHAVDEILNHPELSTWEYILTVEHDNAPPADGIIKLLADMEMPECKDFACIGGLYFTKGPQGVAQLWGDPNDPAPNFRPQVPVPNAIQECWGGGMGFNLWRLKMFKDKRLRRPFFKTQVEGGVSTQDLYFWSDARKYGYRCAVDTRVAVGHWDEANQMMW